MRDCTFEANFDEDGVQVSSGLDARGRELPDPVPFAPPVEKTSADSLIEMIRRAVRQQVSELAADRGFETFEESEDFDIEDDPLDPLTPYEAVFEPRIPRTEAREPPPAAAATDSQQEAGAGGPPPSPTPPAGAPPGAEK